MHFIIRQRNNLKMAPLHAALLRRRSRRTLSRTAVLALAVFYVLVFAAATRLLTTVLTREANIASKSNIAATKSIVLSRANVKVDMPNTTGTKLDRRSSAADVRTPRALYVHARNGLGNRMRAIASAAEAADVSGRKLVVVWEQDGHLNAEFRDLFENDYEVITNATALLSKLSQMTLFDYMNPSKRYSVIDLDVPSDILVSTAFKLNFSGSTDKGYKKALRALQPVPSVFAAALRFQDLSDVIGMHVRMNSFLRSDVPHLGIGYYAPKAVADIIQSREGCNVQNFVVKVKQILKIRPEQMFFVSTDTPSAYKYLRHLFPGRIIPFEHGCTDRAQDCVRKALLTIQLLAKCQRVIGSTWSSFTEVAHDLSAHSEHSRQETACVPKHATQRAHGGSDNAEFLRARSERTFGVCRPGALNLVVSYVAITLENTTDGGLAIRQSEYDMTVQQNLLHPAVKSMHMLVRSQEEAEYLKSAISDPCGLVRIHIEPQDHTYGVLLTTAKRAVPKDEKVMIMNTDIKIGEGFSALMRTSQPFNRSLVYALTRWEEYAGDEADGFCGKNLCPFYENKKGGFLSTDAFIFANPMADTVIKAANFTTHWGGAENLLIHMMKKAGYLFKNPCYLLRVYHNHCSGVRLWARNAASNASHISSSKEQPGWRHNTFNLRIDLQRCDNKWHCGDGYVTSGPTDTL